MSTSALTPGKGTLTPAPKPLVVLAIALATLAAALSTFVLALGSDELQDPLLRAALLDWSVVPYILAGLVAWWRRPESRLGLLMIGGGFAIFLSSLIWADSDIAHTTGQLFDVIPAAVFLHVFLAFPSGRLRGRFEQALVSASYLTAIGPQVAKMLIGDDPSNLIQIASLPEAAQAVEQVQLVAMSAFCLLGIGVLAARRWRGGPPRRRSLTLLIDSFALGLVMIAVLFVMGAFGLSGFEAVRRATFVVIGLAPIAFLIGLLDARLARSAVGDLVITLGRNPPPSDLRDSLARALADPSLTLAYWLPEFRSYADQDGRPVELPADGTRATTLIERDGERVAVLLHDPALKEEPELLDGVTAAARIALENGRLHAELKARLEELRGSRARVIEAGQKERQRLERNLHDGAQQRLIALSLELSLLEERLAADPDARTRLDAARKEIASSLEELRAVARGLHPAVVTGHGLSVALEQLVARAPVPVRLDVELGGRLPERVEVAAFYLVSEGLANIGKHANATSATVEVTRSDGHVVVEVVDDGVGGADTELGSGLRGLADRVESLEGRLRVWSPAGGGTRLRAEIPCAS